METNRGVAMKWVVVALVQVDLHDVLERLVGGRVERIVVAYDVARDAIGVQVQLELQPGVAQVLVLLKYFIIIFVDWVTKIF